MLQFKCKFTPLGDLTRKLQRDQEISHKTRDYTKLLNYIKSNPKTNNDTDIALFNDAYKEYQSKELLLA